MTMMVARVSLKQHDERGLREPIFEHTCLMIVLTAAGAAPVRESERNDAATQHPIRMVAPLIRSGSDAGYGPCLDNASTSGSDLRIRPTVVRGDPAHARSDPKATDEATDDVAQVLVGERERRLYVLRVGNIDYIESQGNYVKLHIDTTHYLRRDSVKHLADVLAPKGFVRIERALLLNVRSVRYLERAERGAYTFTLVTGLCLHSSPTFRDEILRALPVAYRCDATRGSAS